MTSPILLLVRVRLASQRGGRFAKQTNENASTPLWLSRDESAATFSPNKVQIRQDVIIKTRVSLDARVS
jgi:hypothetical protein